MRKGCLMSSPRPSRKRLPVRPSLEHLRKQARRLARASGRPLQQAQHDLAVDYGCATWAELTRVVETMNRGADQLVDVRARQEPLPVAARARDIDAVCRLLDAGDYTPHDLDKALAHAAWYGGDEPGVLRARRAIFDLLLEHGADPDGQYGSAYGPMVLGAGECLDPDGLQWLIDAGADVAFAPVETKYGPQCPLGSWLGTYLRGRNDAKRRGIDLLLRHGAHVPAEATATVLAIHRDDAGDLAALFDADAALPTRVFDGLPYLPVGRLNLLHYACAFGAERCAGLLLERGADPRAPSGDASTPLHFAAAGGAPSLADLLLRHGADPAALDGLGRSPADVARQSPANPHAGALARLLAPA